MHTRYLRDGWNIVWDKYVSWSFMAWKHFRAMGRPIEYQASKTYSVWIQPTFYFNIEPMERVETILHVFSIVWNYSITMKNLSRRVHLFEIDVYDIC